MGPLYAEALVRKFANKIRVEVEVLELKLTRLDGVDPAAAGRPAYHPSINLKPYIYGYLNRVESTDGWNAKPAAT
jgi:transposase